MPRSRGQCAVLALSLSAAVSSAAAGRSGLAVDGTEFVLATADGRVLRSADLAGATVRIRTGAGVISLKIASVERDAGAIGGKVMLHHFVVEGESGATSEYCTPDAAGLRRGFPLPDGRGGFEITCTSGVVAKCVRWGYRFWEERAGGAPLRALHQACLHMARADYGGDGQATTRDGTFIDIYDRFGIQKVEAPASMTFEAAWGVDGAVCVAHPRIAKNISLDAIAERYPRLKSQIGPELCNEAAAMGNPAALLFNRSAE